jgi:hypothetical protein
VNGRIAAPMCRCVPRTMQILSGLLPGAGGRKRKRSSLWDATTVIKTLSEPTMVCSRRVVSGIPHYDGCTADREAERLAGDGWKGNSLPVESWCSGGDLNPHALRHTPLKRTCLPFHHPSTWRVNGKSLMWPRKSCLPPLKCARQG